MGARASAAIVAVALAVACAVESDPDPIEPAEFAELCGQAGPVRILHFEPWRRILDAGYWTTVDGARHLVSVYYEDTSVARSVLWSAGPCGEDPRQLFSGDFQGRVFAPWDLPFVCDELSQVWAIDPTGEREPKVVFQLSKDSCQMHETDVGVVSIWPDAELSETGTLVLHPWPDDIWSDPIAPVVLLDGVKTRYAEPNQSSFDVLQGEQGEVFVGTTDDELVRVTVADGNVEVVATDVRTFDVSYEPWDSEYPRRYLIWQRVELTNEDPELPEGEILLLDRATNEMVSLGQAELRATDRGPLNWTTSDLVQVRLRVDDELVLRLFRLPSLEFVDVDAAIEPRYMLDDDRHLVARVSEEGAEAILDTQTGEMQAIASPATRFWSDRRALAVLPEGIAEDGELLLLTSADAPELVAKRATYYHAFLPDGRVVSNVGLDGDSVGDLIVIDPSSFEERLIDRDVTASPRVVDIDATGEIFVSYTISKGDRAGVWLARPKPLE